MGGGKGGSDFDPKGKSRGEVMRFCQGLMLKLYRHLGADTDLPAGDIGVGAREVGYMVGMMKKLTNNAACVFTGKGLRVAVSGSGNVALYAIEKCLQLGERVVTAPDSGGAVIDDSGFTPEKLAMLMHIKNDRYGCVEDYACERGLRYEAGRKPWGVKVDVALPCATQNELDADDARTLVKQGVKCVAEGTNMPCTLEAVDVFQHAKAHYAPGKASNAGGVATSGLEMTRNAQRLPWTRDEVDARLRSIMADIHTDCVRYGDNGSGGTDYVRGANVAGFVKVADAMLAQGVW